MIRATQHPVSRVTNRDQIAWAANKRIRIAAPRRSNEQAPGAEASRVPQGMIFFRSKNRDIGGVALCESWRRAFKLTARVNVLSTRVISQRKSIKRK